MELFNNWFGAVLKIAAGLIISCLGAFLIFVGLDNLGVASEAINLILPLIMMIIATILVALRFSQATISLVAVGMAAGIAVTILVILLGIWCLDYSGC